MSVKEELNSGARIPSTWSRKTVADGDWLQYKTLTPLSARDDYLADKIDELSGGQGADISELSAKVDTISGTVDTISGTVDSLSDQVDALEAASDVIAVFGTYNDYINGRDNLHATDKDVVKVLIDGDHDDKQTYYQYSTETSSWSTDPIASLEPYYSVNDINNFSAALSSTISSTYLSAKGAVHQGKNIVVTEDTNKPEITISTSGDVEFTSVSADFYGNLTGSATSALTSKSALSAGYATSAGAAPFIQHDHNYTISAKTTAFDISAGIQLSAGDNIEITSAGANAIGISAKDTTYDEYDFITAASSNNIIDAYNWAKDWNTNKINVTSSAASGAEASAWIENNKTDITNLKNIKAFKTIAGIDAATSADTLSITTAGGNISITTGNKTITLSSKDTTYTTANFITATHLTNIETASGYAKDWNDSKDSLIDSAKSGANASSYINTNESKWLNSNQSAYKFITAVGTTTTVFTANGSAAGIQFSAGKNLDLTTATDTIKLDLSSRISPQEILLTGDDGHSTTYSALLNMNKLSVTSVDTQQSTTATGEASYSYIINAATSTNDYVKKSATECNIGNSNSGDSTNHFIQGTNNTGGSNTFVQGTNNIAIQNSISQGVSNSASYNSIAQGNSNTASYYSIAQGDSNSSLNTAFTFGSANTANQNSVAFGQNCYAKNNSFAFGSASRALDNSIAMGIGARASGQKVVLGYYPETHTGTDTTVFAVGYGDDSNRRDVINYRKTGVFTLKTSGNDDLSINLSGQKIYSDSYKFESYFRPICTYSPSSDWNDITAQNVWCYTDGTAKTFNIEIPSTAVASATSKSFRFGLAGTIQDWATILRINPGYDIIIKEIPSGTDWQYSFGPGQGTTLPDYCHYITKESYSTSDARIYFNNLPNIGYLDIAVDTIHQLVSIIKGGAG